LIPFNSIFVDSPQHENEFKRDRHLPKKLATEAEGILKWLVEGCLKYQFEGLNPPQIVQLATNEYQRTEDMLKQFLITCCLLIPSAEIKASDLYNAYKKWMLDKNLRPMSLTKFGEHIKYKFNREKTREGVIYQGLKLLDV
jgi:putative DNA primase/helicase